MESQYKVCEVKLTYKSKIKASEREKILSAEDAYKILLSVFIGTQSSVWEHTTKYARRSSDKKSKGDCQIDWYQPSGSSYHNG